MTEPAIFFLVGCTLDLVLGDPRRAWHPVALFGGWAGKIEAFCRRLPLSDFQRGVIAWLLAVPPVTAAAALSVRLLDCCSPPAGAALAGVWLYATIALRSLLGHAEAVRRPLRRGDLPAARLALGMVVSRDTGELGESEITRGAIESLGENLVDAVNSALFWSALGFLVGGAAGGAAGAVMLRCINTLDACWGYRNERYGAFGRAAARIDDAAHYLPARLSLPVIAVAALLTGGSALGALRAGFRHRADHPSPNSAWSMAAFAGALRLRLGGPTVYGGELEPYPYYGDGRPELCGDDIRHAEVLSAVAAVLFGLLCFGGVALWLLSGS